MQRILDIVLSTIAMVVLLPLTVIVTLILLCNGEGEVFFSQQRIGRKGKPFALLKFATMLKDSPNIGTGTVTLKDDPRVLPFGRVLRHTKINELPQIINVLKGDMSIVGPRPQTPRCFAAFPSESQEEIVKVRPGLSGVGAIIFRGEENMIHASGDPDRFYDEVIMPYKGALECWYVAHRGLAVYLKCIIATFWVVAVSRSHLPWRIFSDLPVPPSELAELLSYPGQ